MIALIALLATCWPKVGPTLVLSKPFVAIPNLRCSAGWTLLTCLGSSSCDWIWKTLSPKSGFGALLDLARR